MITSPNRSARGGGRPGESGTATARLAGEASGAGAGLTFNGWRLDTNVCAVNCRTRRQQAIPLTCGEYAVSVAALAQNARRVLNRELPLALTHNESTGGI